MPVILTPCGWILNWTTDDLVVYKRNNKDVKFYGKSDREILNLFKTNPERMIYDIEEDGEVMELLLHTSESPPKFYRLYQNLPHHRPSDWDATSHIQAHFGGQTYNF